MAQRKPVTGPTPFNFLILYSTRKNILLLLLLLLLLTQRGRIFLS